MSERKACPTCGNDYKDLSQHLNRNYPSHKPDDWPECPCCGERYKNLSRHRGRSDCEFVLPGDDRRKCPTCGDLFARIDSHFSQKPDHRPDSWPKCPKCNIPYESLGQHWAENPDHEPLLTQHQYEVAVGCLMGDGHIARGNKKPYLRMQMTTKEYLEHLQEIFGVLGVGVSLQQTPEELAARTSCLSMSNDPADYSTMFTWSSRGHTAFHKLAEWYNSGEKVWPDDIELTPTVLKHWFCGDGCGVRRGGSYHIQIEMANERGNAEKVKEMFTRVELPEPPIQTFTDKDGTKHFRANFKVEQSKDLIDYMGHPLPGFKYKWPTGY